MKEVTENSPILVSSEYHEMAVRLVQVEAILPTLATKSDLADLRTDMQKMETSMHKMDASIVRWTIATVIALFLGFSGLFFTMQNSVNSRMEYLENTLLRQHGLLNPAPDVGSSAP